MPCTLLAQVFSDEESGDESGDDDELFGAPFDEYDSDGWGDDEEAELTERMDSRERFEDFKASFEDFEDFAARVGLDEVLETFREVLREGLLEERNELHAELAWRRRRRRARTDRVAFEVALRSFIAAHDVWEVAHGAAWRERQRAQREAEEAEAAARAALRASAQQQAEAAAPATPPWQQEERAAEVPDWLTGQREVRIAREAHWQLEVEASHSPTAAVGVLRVATQWRTELEASVQRWRAAQLRESQDWFAWRE